LNWLLKDKEIPKDYQPSEESFGFIYLITYTNGQMYVGKKQIWSKVRVKPLKHQRKNAVRYSIRQMNWQDYEGSAKYDKHLTIAKKEILHICKTKKALTYMEIREQFKRDVLTDAKYVNENINRMWFRGVLDDNKK